MKKIILMFAIMGLIAATYAQPLIPGDIPSKVAKSFEKSYPKVNQVEWSQVENTYKARFVVDEKAISVVYSDSGKLIETEKEISISQLPASILKYVNDNYPGGFITKKVVLTDAKGISSYLVKVNQQALAFNSQGKFQQPETR